MRSSERSARQAAEPADNADRGEWARVRSGRAERARPVIPAVWAVLAFLTLWLGSQQAVAQVTWRTAVPFPRLSLPAVNAHRLAEDVQAWTAGQVRLAVSADPRLAAPPALLNDVRQGKWQAAEFLLASNRGASLLFEMDTLPFLAITPFNVRKLWKESRAPLGDLLRQQGLQLLYASPLPAPKLFTARPIVRLDDLRGLRIWGSGKMIEAFAAAVGAVTAPVPWQDLEAAFRDGRVDAMFVAPEAAVAMAAWEFVPYYLDVPAWTPKSALVVSETALATVRAESTGALAEVLRRAEDRAWRTWENARLAAESRLSGEGMTRLKASTQLRQDLLDAGRQVTADWTGSAGDAAIGIVDRFISLQL